MISSNFYLLLTVLIITIFYSEIFISLIIQNIFKNLKFFSIQLTKSRDNVLFKNYSFNFLTTLLLIFFLTLKIKFSNIIFPFIFIYILISKFINKFFNNFNNFINFNIFLFFILFYFINNFVLFYLFIELYAIIFYFFFLNVNFNFKQLYLIQYKNSLLLYLFNNFLTSILYLIGLNYLIYLFGTVNFYELNFFNSLNSNIFLYFLIISFFFKLSLPGYHFLKIEIYKYLSLNNVILFSVITLYINFILTLFFFNQNIIFFILNSYKFMNLLILCIFFFFIHKLKISNFQEFISYSGFATNNLIILNFLI